MGEAGADGFGLGLFVFGVEAGLGGLEGVGVGIVGEDFSSFDFVDPAVDVEFALVHSRSNHGIGPNIVNLSQNIFRNGDVGEFVSGIMAIVFLQQATGGFGVFEPVVHQGHVFLKFIELE